MVGEIKVDHYSVLGLPSGEEGAKLSQQEISRAYRSLALEIHPDKRPNDPTAHANFLKLKQSYDVLSDGTKRRLFDNAVRAKEKGKTDHCNFDCRRMRMVPVGTFCCGSMRATIYEVRENGVVRNFAIRIRKRRRIGNRKMKGCRV